MALSYPIILAHGICPFDRVIFPLRLLNTEQKDRFHYFRKIRSTLKADGFEVFHSRVSWAGGVSRRAAELRGDLVRVTHQFQRWPRVHIIAHSMGGLDARCMINHFGMDDRVASLTTIGTPHLGSAYADRGFRRLERWIEPARYLGLDLGGFRDLTRARCRTFNRTWEERERRNRVRYQTIAGVQPIEKTSILLRRSFRIIHREEGENDGLVSLNSAKWNKDYFREKIDADHYNQMGWWGGGAGMGTRDRKTFEKRIGEFYLGLAQGLSQSEE